jgi:TRAP-type C4-dicarboxylate transport system permease small subunit
MQPGGLPGRHRALSLAHAMTAAVAQLALGAMLAATLLDVLGRNLGAPLPGASEIVSALLAVTFFAGAALAGRQGSHIGIGIAVDHYGARWRPREALATRCISTVAFAFMAWMALHQAMALQARGVRTEFLNVPLAPVVYALALLAALAAIFTASGRAPTGDSA